MSINGIYTAGVPAGYEAAKEVKRDSQKTGDFMQAAGKTETKETGETTGTEDKSAEHAEKAFMSVGSKAPEEVKKAWMEAAKETGLCGPGIGFWRHDDTYFPDDGTAFEKELVKWRCG